MTATPEQLAALTPKEREILSIAFGRTNKEIAQLCACSPETVKTHLASARRKLGSGSKEHAARAFAEASSSPPPCRVNPSGVMGTSPEPEHQEPVSRETFHEDRAPFDFGRQASMGDAMIHRDALGHDLIPPLERLWQVARLVLAAAVTALLAKSLSEGFQALSGILYPYTH